MLKRERFLSKYFNVLQTTLAAAIYLAEITRRDDTEYRNFCDVPSRELKTKNFKGEQPNLEPR
jgi:hypothetical protein